MSIRAVYAAASGMDALQFKLDMVANNLANANTTAFRRSRPNFEDTYYQHIKLPGLQDANGQRTGVGISVGLGTRVSSTQLQQSQGTPIKTTGPLDLTIVGEGFFQVNDGQQILFTRAGNFTKNVNGEMILGSADRGRLLEPAVTIPQTALEVGISSDGIVSIREQANSAFQQVGQLQLVNFINPQGLLEVGENLYAATSASGDPLPGIPGQSGLGQLRQGFLESSNVEPVTELVDLITSQRCFELNSQVVQAADQQLQVVNNLRRF